MPGNKDDQYVEGEELPELDIADEGGAHDDAPASGEPTQSGDEKPLTRAELLEFQKNLMSSVMSYTDKSVSRVERRYQEVQAANAQALAALKALPGVTPQQIEQAEKQMKDEALRKALDPAAGQKTQDGQQPDGTDAQAVTTQGREIANRYGLTSDAPESALIVSNGTPQQYLQSIEYAGRLFATRTKQQQSRTGRAPTNLPNGSRAPKGNPLQDMESSEDLYDKAWDQIVNPKRN